MFNPFAVFQSLIPTPQLAVGTITGVGGGVATILLLDGQTVQARGVGTTGARVFVKNGLIEGTAPTLATSIISV